MSQRPSTIDNATGPSSEPFLHKEINPEDSQKTKLIDVKRVEFAAPSSPLKVELLAASIGFRLLMALLVLKARSCCKFLHFLIFQ